MNNNKPKGDGMNSDEFENVNDLVNPDGADETPKAEAQSSTHDFSIIGSLKYSGPSLDDGLFDARKSANSLLGFDSALRHFISIQAPSLSTIDYDIPVQIKKGSWIICLPEKAIELAVLGGGITVTAYLSSAAKKLGENDFANVSTKQIFRKAFAAIVWTAKIGKHLKSMKKKRFESVKFENNNNTILIPNEHGEYLAVPKEYLDMYATANPAIFRKIVSPVADNLMLSLETHAQNGTITENITESDREIFNDDTDELQNSENLFPELKHGDTFYFSGELTRGNKTANTLGFKLRGHILTAQPMNGSIVTHKDLIFGDCVMEGFIDRIDANGNATAKRPKLLYTKIRGSEKPLM